MSNELFVEIGTEEIPAGFLAPALRHLEQHLADGLNEQGLTHEKIVSFGTPRRLGLCVTGLPDRQPDRTEEILGPPAAVAFDSEGVPSKAAKGFARSKNVDLHALTIAETPKGKYLMLVREMPGEEAPKIAQQILDSVLPSIPFPKSMRWGSGSIHFARPVQWLVAQWNGTVIPVHLGTVESAGVSRGHRFMAPDRFEVTGYEQYVADLARRSVVVRLEERRAGVVAGVARAVREVAGPNAHALDDPELTDLVTNLVEKPFCVCGGFDDRFLALPDQVLITAMREHQKYFAVADATGALLPYFVAVNNTDIADRTVAVAGHRKVLRARLSDALFFYNEDLKTPLEERARHLDGIVFQARLGTMAAKAERVEKLAARLADQVAPELSGFVRRAASLAKADLLTEMVGEFPSLQGIMGREYSLCFGEAPEVAEAIVDHYRPLRPGDTLPQGMVGALVGIADRMDTIMGCFGINETPTGSADPFGLRRLALGMLHILEEKNLSFSLDTLAMTAAASYGDTLTAGAAGIDKAVAFLVGRFVNDQQKRGVPADVIDAAVAAGMTTVPDTLSRIRALADFSATTQFAVLAGSFKRINNILKGQQVTGKVDGSLLLEDGERHLADVLARVTQKVAAPLQRGEYVNALESMLALSTPVDAFFDQVMVMADDPRLRQNRLNLLMKLSSLFLQVGDLSRCSR